MLDEATAAPGSGYQEVPINQAMDRLTGRIAPMVAHWLHRCPCDRAVVLTHGWSSEDGTHEELAGWKRSRQALWRQFQGREMVPATV